MVTQLCPSSTARDTSASSQLPTCIDSQLITRQVKGKAQSCSRITVLCAGKCLQELKDNLSPPQLRSWHLGTSASTPSLPPGGCSRGKSLFLLEHLLWMCSTIILSLCKHKSLPLLR